MQINEFENSIKDKLKWKHVSSIQEFPLKSYEEVIEKIQSKEFSIGVDFTTANKLAEWIYGKSYGYFFLLLAWVQLLVPIFSIILAFTLGEYWLFLGILFGPIGFLVANPYNPSKKLFNTITFFISLLFIYSILQGRETIIYLTAFFIIPFLTNKYIYYTNQRKLENLALTSEDVFIFLYQNRALGLKNNETKTMYFYKESKEHSEGIKK